MRNRETWHRIFLAEFGSLDDLQCNASCLTSSILEMNLPERGIRTASILERYITLLG